MSCCNDPYLIKSNGQIVCKNCGHVDDIIYNDAPKSISLKINLLSSGSMIGTKKEREKFSKSINYVKLNHLNNQNNLRTIYRHYLLLSNMCSVLDLPYNVKNNSWIILNKAHNLKKIIGRSLEDFVGASIYLGCKVSGFSQSISNLAEKIRVKKTSIYNTYKVLLNDVLPSLKKDYPLLEWETKSPKTISLFKSYAEELNFTREEKVLGIKILNKMKNILTPNVKVAGVLYYISKMHKRKITQKEICNLVTTSEVSLRKVYHYINSNL